MPEVLTPIQLKYVVHAANGLTHMQSAEKEGVGYQTAKSHWRRIYKRLGASGTTHAVAIAYRRGILSPDAILGRRVEVREKIYLRNTSTPAREVDPGEADLREMFCSEESRWALIEYGRAVKRGEHGPPTGGESWKELRDRCATIGAIKRATRVAGEVDVQSGRRMYTAGDGSTENSAQVQREGPRDPSGADSGGELQEHSGAPSRDSSGHAERLVEVRA